MTSPSVDAYSGSSFAAPSAPTGSNIGGGSTGSNEGGSYGIAVIPAPGANLVVPHLTSGLAVIPASRVSSVVSSLTSGAVVSPALGENSFAPPLPLTVVPPLANCSLVRWVFVNHS